MKTTSLLTGKVYDTAVQTVKENQIVIHNYGTETRWAVCKIDFDALVGYTYHVVSLDNPHFMSATHIRPLRERFGIGWYFDDETLEFMDAFEVAVLRAQAQAKADAQAEERRIADERNARLTAIGRERLQNLVPTDAQAVIVAELHEDDSDPYTDYYSHRTVRTVILGFSRHTRDLFPEMRKHATNFEGTAYLAEEKAEYEHREKYAGGTGFYLGGSLRNGWCVRKERIGDRDRFIERYARIAGVEGNICVSAPAQTAQPTGTSTKTVTGNFKIVAYSERAIAVFGDTRAVKDALKALGGRFNPKLSREGVKTAGWIFQKSKESDLRNLLTIK